MRFLITGLALALLAGCDSYTVELNPNWEEDSSEASIQDPTTAAPSVVDPSSEDPSVEDTTTEDPVDTEPPVIDLSLDDEPADPDEKLALGFRAKLPGCERQLGDMRCAVVEILVKSR